ncbi:glutamate--ammonia ligase [Stylonychia lemnae]|uniref:Glutamate--ammonia ligase n=1 Tax=Stylonychia lemnae TaxID=5949 RepID=A0A078BDJ3_STYLE|nr:glutamate--ammonia ligase [Stylonychia lemnae]|eukprot:CDW91658.1 glutamate--ammonia ligase [Stylonychia lemnae]
MESTQNLAQSDNQNQEEQYDHVILSWQPYNGMRHAHLTRKEIYDQRDQKSQIAIVPALMLFMPMTHDVLLPNYPIPNLLDGIIMKPDHSSFKILKVGGNTESGTKSVNIGFVNCSFNYKDMSLCDYCPRNLVKRAILALQQKHNISVKIGYEIEFNVLDMDGKPINKHSGLNLDALLKQSDVLIRISNELNSQGVRVLNMHKESSHGQYEIVLDYDDVLKSIDNYNFAIQVIKQNFQREGKQISLLPRPFENQFCNGLHIHMSIWRDGKNILGDSAGQHLLTVEGQQFMAGILEHSSAINHFLAPSPNSMKRIQSHMCAGTFKIWGLENRDAILRLIQTDSVEGRPTHFELKALDHTANQCFALASVLVAATNGLDKEMKLPQPVNDVPLFIPEDAWQEKGITILPQTYEDRKVAVYSEENKVLLEFFGKPLIDNIFLISDEDFKELDGKSISEQFELLNSKF